MMRTRPAALLVLASLSLAVAAPAAHAQDPDLIGDLLRAVPTPDAQEEEEADGGDLDLPEVVEAPSTRTGPTSVPGQRVGV
ncbi:MAG: hypothetical protein IM649_11380, partial [Phenylobacterium sp.]|nr:hypothetical protein [Phenylobacterium sp.]